MENKVADDLSRFQTALDFSRREFLDIHILEDATLLAEFMLATQSVASRSG